MDLDPAVSNAQFYKVVFENDRVRVLEYTDSPGDRTTPHAHPDSVMYTLSSFRRRLHQGDQHRDVEITAGTTGWLPAQQHAGENIGDTPTHVLFVELKGGPAGGDGQALGPASPQLRASYRPTRPPPGSRNVVTRPQPWSLTGASNSTPRPVHSATVASTSSHTRYSSIAPEVAAGWTATSPGGSWAISQPPPASTVGRSSRSTRNRRSASASLLYRITCAPLITPRP
jgi:hypothetical protein